MADRIAGDNPLSRPTRMPARMRFRTWLILGSVAFGAWQAVRKMRRNASERAMTAT